MDGQSLQPVESIPIDRIRVLNPRTRSKRQHQAIIDSIAAVGLKKPITVSKRLASSDGYTYDLVCGQGRLEAIRLLGGETIPARIVVKDEADCLLMSLIENVARRNHSTQELLRDIQDLRQHGYEDEDIATKVGLSAAYLQSLMFLLDRGEERLLAAVDNGTIPIAIAIHIARAEEEQVQSALMDAYINGTLKGKQLAVVRKLLERRIATGERKLKPSGINPGSRSKQLSPDYLRRVYMRESNRHKLLAKRAEVVHARLSFIVHALRVLMHEKEFIELLDQQKLTTLPRVLEQRINSGVPTWTD
ncbi:plasmid partitioning protein RepB C-terminal domain-containing protein [Paraburkholderia diazotrophica]|uniref:Chromosome partitioning protein, ParB family n=1 Tax=Paraburkholderia diazotrophica TaxID=667676 RepID=A0A1H7D7J8_9BURK|nr:plasmid partitioning protein RepB C-terminal domain-containing protein [Paraburkholderia diazotrophica]SEJ96827.1 chromosome partitioning protein, ParB family [Paraburkholderia diazotrophica]